MTENLMRLVIGGPARCGKTSLANHINENDDTCFVLGVDALFRVLLRKSKKTKGKETLRLVQHFLTRPRYQDSSRTKTETAMDFTSLSLPELIEKAGVSDTDHAISAYGRTFDEIAYDVRKRAWVTFDLHPEFIYGHLRDCIPSLKLFAMYRDPHEAIAASIYWRKNGTADEQTHKRREFRISLTLWALSVVATLSHQKKWPDDVSVLTLSDLLNRNNDTPIPWLSFRPASCEIIESDTLHFHYRDGGFLLPNGQIAPLLSNREHCEINALLAPLAESIGVSLAISPTSKSSVGVCLKLYFGFFTWLAKRDPELAYSIMHGLEFPAGFFRGNLMALRQRCQVFFLSMRRCRKN